MKVVLLALFSVFAFAQSNRTFGQYNGLFWNDLSQNEKGMYLAGVLDTSGIIEDYGHKSIWPAHDTIGAMIPILDYFYPDSLNKPIAIVRAIRVISNRAAGASAEEDTKSIAAERALAAEAAHPANP